MHIALCNDVDIPLSDTELCVPCTEYSGSGHDVGYLMTYLCVRREPASGYKRYLTYLCEIHESEPDGGSRDCEEWKDDRGRIA